MIPGHVEHPTEASSERLKAVFDGNERIAHVARDDERVVFVRSLRQAGSPFLGSWVVEMYI
eukprot:CAMPEP_0181217246 /NCGR_PEP_ID=MMETSP1096-20121128/27045_1 /TAXON_ID=156174 ORGANISM="Chrysochromulina ericina, Strain CCMP281" /NCGR_SAMPLE_ID=MMETSP1096 /ASSEMBLY_ACC=CAM_ASM_000453 /LENGTH=60 /DNA_ID=CAMNT_0023309357 /DNA_START=701 /DNA_END=883 /DNA_ORIENTATION=+